ncbi:hypothetical protein EJ05DRAFT_334573 [Pseudovirgaria hyperparasitica]|uniref:Uncharacterized protein n=1 Tax=Pseudovirgaria hyperparasitica TaxID=470096 RepID=A0A6A6WB03_9PEZI|nr:uncharacterized protein EJ05DRAFT_334573 [Pseudovirgaria hyperparasitica]KAF2759140.1 hypothetical protein EJ05DRAFT_334573 [Pseudovirgaria hyperparasitica]
MALTWIPRTTGYGATLSLSFAATCSIDVGLPRMTIQLLPRCIDTSTVASDNLHAPNMTYAGKLSRCRPAPIRTWSYGVIFNTYNNASA